MTTEKLSDAQKAELFHLGITAPLSDLVRMLKETPAGEKRTILKGYVLARGYSTGPVTDKIHNIVAVDLARIEERVLGQEQDGS